MRRQLRVQRPADAFPVQATEFVGVDRVRRRHQLAAAERVADGDGGVFPREHPDVDAPFSYRVREPGRVADDVGAARRELRDGAVARNQPTILQVAQVVGDALVGVDLHLVAAELLEARLGAIGRDDADVEDVVAREDPDIAVGVAGIDVEVKIIGIREIDVTGAELVLQPRQQSQLVVTLEANLRHQHRDPPFGNHQLPRLRDRAVLRGERPMAILAAHLRDAYAFMPLGARLDRVVRDGAVKPPAVD